MDFLEIGLKKNNLELVKLLINIISAKEFEKIIEIDCKNEANNEN